MTEGVCRYCGPVDLPENVFEMVDHLNSEQHRAAERLARWIDTAIAPASDR